MFILKIKPHFSDWYVKREEFNVLRHSYEELQHSHDALLLDYHGLEHLFHHHVQASNTQHQWLVEQMQRRDRLVVGTILFVLVFIVVYLNRHIFSLWSSSEL